MSKLVLKRFHCQHKNDDLGDDSLYFLVFHGRGPRNGQAAASDVKLVRRQTWDDKVAEGETVGANNYPVIDPLSDDLVIAALLEEDWDKDFKQAKLNALRALINPFFVNLASSVLTGVDGTVASLVQQEFVKRIKQLADNDDFIQLRQVIGPNKPLAQQPMTFKNGGTRYNVWFAIE